MVEKIHTVDEVFGVSRDLPLNYVTREHVDGKLIDNLSRNAHIVIYGSSKQGKTSLRKYCLRDQDYIVVSCQNKWSLAETHAAILKECGYQVTQSTSKTVSGTHKITASIQGKGGVPLVAQATTTGGYEYDRNSSETKASKELELDPGDVNDIIRALSTIEFTKYIVLEDFHYLPDETQKEFSFSLKAFHEKSKISFIVVGVWREENRLIAHNGDLTDRVFSVDVDTWSPEALREVISIGESLLNVQFESRFVEDLVKECFDSVHIVQEVCRRCLRNVGIFQTQEELIQVVPDKTAKELIAAVVNDQKGRYSGFLMNFADGFQQTELEMPKWIIYSLLISTVDQIREGLRLREVSRLIKDAHPKGDDLNNGNITQALISASSLQVKKNIRPIIIDYDTTNRNLEVVDKGFLIWLAAQDREELLADLGVARPSAAS